MDYLRKWILLGCLLSFMKSGSSQILDVANNTDRNLRICRGAYVSDRANSSLSLLGCELILGNLRIVLMDRLYNYTNVSFPDIREVTGFVTLYRLNRIISLSEILPNLARIRGRELFKNYGLIIQDMGILEEVGLYNFVRLDRGQISIQQSEYACYVKSIDWGAIAPDSHYIIGDDYQPVLDVLTRDRQVAVCENKCNCSPDPKLNYCWNNKTCQIFTDGRDGMKCHKECLGCRRDNPNACIVCRHYTYKVKCVHTCPEGTIPMEEMAQCLTREQCYKIRGLIFNETCLMECPYDYEKIMITQNDSNEITCQPCSNCKETCRSLRIRTLSDIDNARGCVYVNGSLTISIRNLATAMRELRASLKRIREVWHYIVIEESEVITSLDFLPSLVLIRGEQLVQNKFSLMVYGLQVLKTLFTPQVTEVLTIEKGAFTFYNNPKLCKSEINKLNHLFVDMHELSAPEGLNGYNGGCTHDDLSLEVKDIETNTALVKFRRKDNSSLSYSILYTRLSPGEITDIVPESCSVNHWHVVNADHIEQKQIFIKLDNLHPASDYVLCVETYDYDDRHLIRSPMIKFSTQVGLPAPPFITKAVATSSNSIVINWLTHRDYRRFITHFNIDLVLTNVFDEDVNVRDQCEDPASQEIVFTDYEHSAHVVMKSPPEEYRKCEKVVSCDASRRHRNRYYDEVQGIEPCEFDCLHGEELNSPNNVTFTAYEYYKTFSAVIDANVSEFRIRNLAPYRDYRIRLRACSDTACSRSSRRVVRTKSQRNADLAYIVNVDSYNGTIKVVWEAPIVSNGPILSYSLQLKPTKFWSSSTFDIPVSLCFQSNEREATINSLVPDFYMLRICTLTMAPEVTCTDWATVPRGYLSLWWIYWSYGFTAAITILTLGLFIQRCSCFHAALKRSFRRRNSEDSATSPVLPISPAEEQDTNTTTVSTVNPFSDPKPSTSRATVEIELRTYKSPEYSTSEELEEIKETTVSSPEAAEESKDEISTQATASSTDASTDSLDFDTDGVKPLIKSKGRVKKMGQSDIPEQEMSTITSSSTTPSETKELLEEEEDTPL